MFPKENEINNGRKRKESYIQMHYNEFYAYLFNNYDFCESFVEKLYCYYNNITERPACRFCGNKIKFISFTKGYKKFCSSKCAANSVETRNKAKQTCLKKYGADNPSKTEQTKNKIANTKIERYNDKNFNNRNKYKQTCLERYGVESPFASDIIKDKIKQTCLERYGVESPTQSDKVKEKYKQTCLERYGVESPFASDIIKDKIKQTCLERYGVESPTQSDKVKEKYKQTCLERYGVESPFASDIIKDKIKQTCLERYGIEKYVLSNDHEVKTKRTCLIRYNTENYTQSNEYKNMLPTIQQKIYETCLKKYGTKCYTKSNEYKNMLPTIQQKIYETKKNNNSFNKSNIEEQFASWLDENNILYIRQYKSEQYPFCCDFYFPEKDLYFEINGHCVHNNHPFNPDNKKDIATLEKWKQKGTKFYKNMIHVWTVTDPLKVKTANENNLNFKVVYSCKLDEAIKEYKK